MLASLACAWLPSNVSATCAGGSAGFVIWPRADASDVPIDTPIVVAAYQTDVNTKPIETTLAASDGSPVALVEVKQLPPPWLGCGAAETVFLRPEQPLRSGETYTLSVAVGDKGPVNRSMFQVGAKTHVAEAELRPDITYLKVFTRPECVREACDDFANLRVDLGQAPPRPLWLRVKGSHAPPNTHGWTFYPMGWSVQGDQFPELLSAIQLSVPLAAADSCVDMQIYGVEGRALLEERLCEPDRCAVYSILAGTNTAGVPGGSPLDVRDVPDGSCADPPVLPSDPAGQVVSVDAGMDSGVLDPDLQKDAAAPRDSSKKPLANPRRSAANGCSVSQGAASTSASGVLTVLALLALWLRRRQTGLQPG